MNDDEFDALMSGVSAGYTNEVDDYEDAHRHDDDYGSYLSDLYAENIEEFTSERLQSYYLDNRILAKPALDFLIEARNLISSNATACLIFAAIAMEVGLMRIPVTMDSDSVF